MRLDDFLEASLHAAVAAIGVGMEAAHQQLVARLDRLLVRRLVQPKRLQRLAGGEAGRALPAVAGLRCAAAVRNKLNGSAMRPSVSMRERMPADPFTPIFQVGRWPTWSAFIWLVTSVSFMPLK